MLHNDFTTGSVRRQILMQALPLTFAQVVQLLYNIVDRMYIGHMPGDGGMALTGLGITFPVIVLIAAFTSLFATGGTPLFAMALGRRDEKEAGCVLGNSFVMLTLSSILLFLVGKGLARPILFLFGASEASFVYAQKYLSIYLYGTLFSMLSTGLNGFINAQGFPGIGMLTVVIGALLNAALDPLFIFALHMGVEGAALATVISQSVSCIWVMHFLLRGKAQVPLTRAGMRLQGKRVGQMVLLGIPGFVMQGTNSLTQIVANNQLQLFGGDMYVSIMTIVSSTNEILTLPISGLCNGAQPVMSFHYGAGERDTVKEGIRFTTLVSLGYGVMAWLFAMLFPTFFIRLFSSDARMALEGAVMLRLCFCGYAFMTCQHVGQASFRALGKAREAIFFSLFRKVVIVVPLTLLLPPLGLGVRGVFIAEPISQLIGGLACIVTMYRTVYRKL